MNEVEKITALAWLKDAQRAVYKYEEKMQEGAPVLLEERLTCLSEVVEALANALTALGNLILGVDIECEIADEDNGKGRWL